MFTTFFVNALLHINTAPHTPCWQLPSTTTVSHCWLPDDPSGGNKSCIPCSTAEGIVLVNHFVYAYFPGILLHPSHLVFMLPFSLLLTLKQPQQLLETCFAHFCSIFQRARSRSPAGTSGEDC